MDKLYVVLRDEFKRDDFLFQDTNFDTIYMMAENELRIVWNDWHTPLQQSIRTAFVDMVHNGSVVIRLHGTENKLHISEYWSDDDDA